FFAFPHIRGPGGRLCAFVHHAQRRPESPPVRFCLTAHNGGPSGRLYAGKMVAVPESGEWPRVYRTSLVDRLSQGVPCAIFAVAGLGVAWISFAPELNVVERFYSLSLSLAAIAFFGWLFLSAVRFKVSLFGDRIEIRRALRTESFSRKELRG